MMALLLLFVLIFIEKVKQRCQLEPKKGINLVIIFDLITIIYY